MTAREILLRILAQTDPAYLADEYGDDSHETIADWILAARVTEVARDLERREADAYPGTIYGAVRRMRAGHYANQLRQMNAEVEL